MRKSLSIESLMVLAAVLPLAGMNGNCDGFQIPGTPTCGTKDVPAVRLTIVDEQGLTLPSASIAFSVNGSQYFVGNCTNDCKDFTIAFDITGQFNISVIAPGYQQDDRMVTVGAMDDMCTPITRDVIIVMKEDFTVAVLAGAWRAQTVFGNIDLRFGSNGEAIGAILYDRTIAGDGNFYVAYNGNPIRGVAGQQTAAVAAANPTRVGDIFNFNGEALGVPVGFVDAQMSGDFNAVSGRQPGAQSQGLFVTYSRLADIPTALQTP